MLRNLFSSPSSGLPLKDVLELANKHLENARNAGTPTKALLLCDQAKAAIKEAENVVTNKKTRGQTLNDDIANVYHKHGKLLEELRQHSKAQKSLSKAKKWGYVHVATQQPGSPRSANPNDSIRRSLCPQAALSATPTISAAIFQGILDFSNAPPINHEFTEDPTPRETKDQILVTGDETAQGRQAIFLQNVAPPVAEFALPEFNARITSTSQLAYCLSLLNPSLASKGLLNKTESVWLQARDNDLDEKERLQTMATDVIRAFVRDEFKTSDVVAEAVNLAAVLQQDELRKLLGVFVDGIEQSLLLKAHLLDGLAYLMKNAPLGDFDADDLVKILELLSMRLKGTHQQYTQRTYRLVVTVSRVLDSMVDSQVKGLEREQLHEPLSQYLKELQQSSDSCLVYQAAYAYQALQYIPDGETALRTVMRHTRKVVEGVSGVVSAVEALDLDRFIERLHRIQGVLTGAGKAVVIVNDAYRDAMILAESGQGLLESLNEGFSFTRKSAWYPALRGLDALLQEGRLTESEKLIREAPCRQDPAFQWGVCQRLGELAANKLWDIDTRQCAISFLGEMYTNDAWWGQQANTKQWILGILRNLIESSEGVVASHAKRLLQDLGTDGDSKKRALYQACIKENQSPYILIDAMPLPQQSRLLDCVQNKPDVESPLRQFKQEQLRMRGQDVYISPRAKFNASATEDFDLTSKVHEFLSSNKKVFLLLGDSGAGKSTFNRALEIDLWHKYKKDGRIPLFIYLPTIERPEQHLIEEPLRRANFTENQIRELKLHHEFILICDGYDESQQTRNLYTSNQLNQPGQWRAQIVISCRTEYTDIDYRDCFQPTDCNGRGISRLFQEAILTPFDKNQIQDYIDQYVSWSKPSWGTKDYLQALKQIPNLQDLVTNPFLLKITVDVLPELVGTKSDLTQIRITRVELYDGFIAQWIERGKIRLSEMELSPRDKEALKILQGSGFVQHCVEYLKELATAIYDNQNGVPVVSYSYYRDQKTWKSALFNNSDGRNLLREAIPLIRNSDQYRFMHRSVLEYGLALAVFDPSAHNEEKEPVSNLSRRGSTKSILSFEEHALTETPATTIEQPLLDSPFGRRSYVDEPSISQFLVERAQQQDVFKEQLHAVVERSKADKTTRIAAANSITVLVRAGVRFIKADLRGIKIPGADLSYGMFDSVRLDGADLRKVNLRNIWLRKANLCGTQMKGVQFGELPLLYEDSPVRCCAYSRDGKSLALGLENGDVSLYETSSWKKIQTLSDHIDEINCLVFSEASDRIAFGSGDSKVRLWDVETGHCILTLQGHTRKVTGIAYSPKGCHIASGSEDKTVRLWNAETGDCVQAFQGHRDRVRSVAYSTNGDQIASGCRDGTVRLWNVETGNCIQTLRGHKHDVVSLAYSPDGDRIASGSWDKTVRLWNLETGDCVHELQGHSDFVYSIAYSPNGDRIASGSADLTILLWDVETGNCVHTLSGHNNVVVSVVYSPDGDQIASASGGKAAWLWNVKHDNFIHTLQGHTSVISSAVPSPTGGLIASGSLDTTLRLWNVEAGKCIHTLQGHIYPVVGVAYSPRGDLIASGSLDATVRLWNVETGNCVHTFQDHSEAILSIAYSPNGDLIASGSSDKTLRLWNAETGNCVQILEGHDGEVGKVVYSPNGDQVASRSYDETIRLWNVETGKCIHTIESRGEDIHNVVYSPKGDQIAFGSDDNTVRLWNVETGCCVHTLRGHTKTAFSLMYSPNGDRIASGSKDWTVRLWDAETGKCVHNLRGHRFPVVSVVYSTNGDQIASGSGDRTVRLWATETGQCLVAISGFQGSIYIIIWDDTLQGQYLVTGSYQSLRRWQIIKEQDEYTAHLCWSSSNILSVADASFDHVQGLSRVNRKLLSQQGASIATPPSTP